MRAKVVVITCLLVWGLAAVAVAEDDYAKLPGYVDFSSLGIAGADEPTVEVFLKGSLLKLVASSEMKEDPVLAGMLSKLAVIRVQTYSLKGKTADDYEKQIAAISKRLDAGGWETIVRVREVGERVHVAIKTAGERIVGLVVMAFEQSDEAAFINIVGDIDLEQIGKLGEGLHISPLDTLNLPSRKAPKQEPH